MKYLILMFLILAGCETDQCRSVSIPHQGTICRKYKMEQCGVRIWRCDNGMVYDCLKSISMTETYEGCWSD